MPKSKNRKVRKRYNHLEVAIRKNSRAVKDCLVAQVTTLESERSYPCLFNEDGKRVELTPIVREVLTTYPYPWQIHVCVGCLTSKGDREIKEIVVAPNGRHIYANIWESVATIHAELLEDLQDKNVRVIFVGWISNPNGEEVGIERIYDIFEEMDGWNL